MKITTSDAIDSDLAVDQSLKKKLYVVSSDGDIAGAFYSSRIVALLVAALKSLSGKDVSVRDGSGESVWNFHGTDCEN